MGCDRKLVQGQKTPVYPNIKRTYNPLSSNVSSHYFANILGHPPQICCHSCIIFGQAELIARLEEDDNGADNGAEVAKAKGFCSGFNNPKRLNNGEAEKMFNQTNPLNITPLEQTART